MTPPGAAVIICAEMKKTLTTHRKHGRKTQQKLSATRLTTQVTFESSSQSYFWLTDRGRARLIKH